MGEPEIDEDTPGKAFVYFTAMVREPTELLEIRARRQELRYDSEGVHAMRDGA